MVIDDVIQPTLDYQSRKTCKDFLREHNMQLLDKQAWKLKEKVKVIISWETIYYYKFVALDL